MQPVIYIVMFSLPYFDSAHYKPRSARRDTKKLN